MARDDFDDRPARAAAGGMDGFLSNMVAVVLLSLVSFFCCPLLGLVLGGIGMGTTTTALAKRNSTILLVVSVVAIVVNIGLYATGALNFNAAQFQGAPK